MYSGRRGGWRGDCAYSCWARQFLKLSSNVSLQSRLRPSPKGGSPTLNLPRKLQGRNHGISVARTEARSEAPRAGAPGDGAKRRDPREEEVKKRTTWAISSTILITLHCERNIRSHNGSNSSPPHRPSAPKACCPPTLCPFRVSFSSSPCVAYPRRMATGAHTSANTRETRRTNTPKRERPHVCTYV